MNPKFLVTAAFAALIAAGSASPVSAQYHSLYSGRGAPYGYYYGPYYGTYTTHPEQVAIMNARRAYARRKHQHQLAVMAARREYAWRKHQHQLEVMAARRGYYYGGW